MWNLKNTSARRAVSVASLATIALLTMTAVAGCSRIGQLQAARSVEGRECGLCGAGLPACGRALRRSHQGRTRISGSRTSISATPTSSSTSRAGRASPTNDALLTKAVDNYKIAVERLATATTEQEKNLAGLALRYLVSSYGIDKLNDPAQQEPILISMIKRDPADPQGYFMLANVYEQAGEYPHAERVFLLARDVKPTDPEVYLQLAGLLQPAGPVRQDDRGARAARRARAEKPRGVSDDRRLLLRRSAGRRPAHGRRKADLHRQGPARRSTRRSS